MDTTGRRRHHGQSYIADPRFQHLFTRVTPRRFAASNRPLQMVNIHQRVGDEVNPRHFQQAEQA